MEFPLVGWVLILSAAAVVALMVWAVAREQHEHEEHYIPGLNDETPADESKADGA